MKRIPVPTLLGFLGLASLGAACAPNRLHLFDGPRYQYAFEEETTGEDRERERIVKTRGPGEIDSCREECVDYLGKNTPFKALVWDTPIRGEILTRLTLHRNSLFAETRSGKVYRLDAETGFVTWVYDIGSPLDFPPCSVEGLEKEQTGLQRQIAEQKRNLEDPAVTGDPRRKSQIESEISEMEQRLGRIGQTDYVYCLSRGTLHGLDSRGNLLWKQPLSVAASSPIFATPKVLYVGSMEWNRAWALDAETGKPLGWFEAGGVLRARPVYEQPLLMTASESGEVNAYGASGSLAWRFAAERPIHADLAVDGDRLYVGSTDFALYALNRITGRVLWKHESGAPITTAAVTTPRTVFVRADGSGLLALEPADGRLRWKLPQGDRVLLNGTDRLYVEGTDGLVYGVDERTGDVKSKFDPAFFSLRVPSPSAPIFYGATKDGFIFAARESKAKF